MELYDPFYASDLSVFNRKYDFITATEVIEHLYHPREELERLWDCLKADGWLGIMTKPLVSKEQFPNWHYKRDDTHVAFYSKPVFHWLRHQWNATLIFPKPDVILFQKTGG